MKRKILPILLVVALLAVVGGVTLAYFTSRDAVENVFTVGSVKIKLEEPQWDPTQDHVLIPGVEYAKDPTVSNTGNIDAYVRLNVTVSDYAALTADLPGGYELSQLFQGVDTAKWIFAGAKQDTAADTVTYSYYFHTRLAPGANTGALFTAVKVPAALSSAAVETMGNEFTITVTADAIQAETFTGPVDAFQAFDAQMNVNP